MRLVPILALLALAGCYTPCPDAPTGPRQQAFVCADGSELSVTFNIRPGRAYIVQDGFAPIELPADITSAGYRYAEGGAELRGQGAQAQWTRPGAAETLCRETR
jgi:hypothetical protein